MPAQPFPAHHDRPAPTRQLLWLALCWLLLLCLTSAPRAQAAPQPLPLTVQGIHNLGDSGQLFYADKLPPASETSTPPNTANLQAWLASLRPAKEINLFGGAY